ncbi:hemolysin family protein [Methyloligella sp. 2.7D]|uniref:hemolysin family protein n=1 Tax=unclassified Methyloligella TaxID=2625955 RepID=UPI00157CE1D8|nr:hemolysin family protein [Methyloligella sp. GL2]QKP78605.1 HlyC/CorC family transporter [Methyloligella sp. GL2]
MSNAALPENDPAPENGRQSDDEPSWLERILSRFGLGEAADLRTLIEDAISRSPDASDSFSATERTMLLNILRFGKLTVEDVMVPRADIVAVEDGISVEELLGIFREAEHSRLPVFHNTLDEPRGLIHIRDLMSWIAEEAEKANGADLSFGNVDLTRKVRELSLVRDILYVPGSQSVTDLLLKMQTSRVHLALVVDEYGGTDGLVSIEDLIEQVVGDIEDEHDVDDAPLITRDKLGLVADARVPVEELEEQLGVTLIDPEEDDDIDTLGGLVFSLSGRIPVRGELLKHPSGVEFEVLDADPRRIKKLRIHTRNLPADGEDGKTEDRS